MTDKHLISSAALQAEIAALSERVAELEGAYSERIATLEAELETMRKGARRIAGLIARDGYFSDEDPDGDKLYALVCRLYETRGGLK